MRGIRFRLPSFSNGHRRSPSEGEARPVLPPPEKIDKVAVPNGPAVSISPTKTSFDLKFGLESAETLSKLTVQDIDLTKSEVSPLHTDLQKPSDETPIEHDEKAPPLKHSLSRASSYFKLDKEEEEWLRENIFGFGSEKNRPKKRTPTPEETLNATRTIQNAWRKYCLIKKNRALGKEYADEEIRHPETREVIGYVDHKMKTTPNETLTNGIYHKPPPIPTESERPRGTEKIMSHKDTNKDFITRYGGLALFKRHKYSFRTFWLNKKVRDKLKALDHSHVVIQREIREGEFLAKLMEGDLIDRARQNKPLPFAGFEPALRILKGWHEEDVVHRDIKSDNMLVLKDEAYWTDFDTADIVDDIKAKRRIPGVPAYMDERLLRHLRDCKSSSELATQEQKKYAKVMDNYAMTIVLIQNEIGCDLKTLSADLTFSTFDAKAKAEITKWISRYAKPEHAQNFRDLLEDPMSYLEKHAGKVPHLYDMLNFNGSTSPSTRM